MCRRGFHVLGETVAPLHDRQATWDLAVAPAKLDGHEAWVIRATGSPLAPAWYMFAAAVIGLGAMTAMRETAPIASHLARK